MTDTHHASKKKNRSPDAVATNPGDTSWHAANVATTVSITSGLIALVHNPLNALMMILKMNKKNKTPLAASLTNNGLLSLVRTLYAGFWPYFASTGSRTLYMSEVKKIDQERKSHPDLLNENIPSMQKTATTQHSEESCTNQLERIGFITAMSLGELVVTQTSEALSLVEKVIKKKKTEGSLQNFDFKWYTSHNFKQLSVTTAGARFGFGFVSFSALCEAEQRYASMLPIQNETTRHFFAGALGGATAALLSYPFANYRNYHLSEINVIDGKIIFPGAKKIFTDFYTHIRHIGFTAGAKEALNEFMVQAPLMVARTSTRFALIAGVSSYLGNEPLRHIVDKEAFISTTTKALGFFQKSHPAKLIPTQPEKTKTSGL